MAVEFASIFHGLGVEVVQLYRGDLFLRGFDHDVRQLLAAEMRRQGVDLRFAAQILRVEKNTDQYTVFLNDGGSVEVDLVMFATGRQANTAKLGLETAGVDLNADGSIRVDSCLRTSQPHIFALGDVIGGVQLTPVAIAQAMAFCAGADWGEG